MRNSILFNIFFLSIIIGQSFTEWAISSGGSNQDIGSSITVDQSGDVLVTGHFRGTADFDSGSSTTNLTSAGDDDIFMAKYGSDGSLTWAKSMGGSNQDYGTSITVDGSGSIYVTGYFQGTADFDPGSSTAILSSAGNDDIFIAKYDSDGSLIWVNRLGANSKDYGSSIIVDDSNYVYLTGYFQGTADFDPSSSTTNLTSAGHEDIFLAKYNLNGALIWAKSTGSSLEDFGQTIVLDSSGNIHITGYFIGTVDFDFNSGGTNLSSAGGSDVFMAKYDTDGLLIWAKNIGGVSYEYAQYIAVDNIGNVYLTGFFKNTVDFDPSNETVNLTSAGDYDIYLAKYDSGGSLTWARNMGGSAGDFASSMVLNSSANIYLTGNFQGTADFDPDSGITNLSSLGGDDIFLAKYNSYGSLTWAKNMGGTTDDYGSSIVINGNGNIYLTGFYQGTVDFDPDSGTANLTSIGDLDVFIAKYNDNIPPIWSDIPDTSIHEDSNLYMDLDNFVYDNGDPDSTLRISIEGGEQIYYYLDSLSHIVNFSSIPDSSGFTENFIVTVTDPWGGTDVDTFSISILPPIESVVGENFAIIPIPDTQGYTQSFPANFNAQMEWIVESRDSLNIVYVAHEGDIVQTSSSILQWQNADTAMMILETDLSDGFPDGIPYGMVPGNHDMPTTNYNLYFGPDRYLGRNYYGGVYEYPTNDNNYTLFSASGMDFIVINLSWDFNVWVLNWAENLLQTYNNRRAIVVSHYIVKSDSTFTMRGENIYNALKDNSNLFLMLCGHVKAERIRTDTYEGNVIYSLLANYQDRPNGGNGWLRILQFYPSNNEIQVKTYSPVLDSLETDSDSEFTLFYYMGGNIPPVLASINDQFTNEDTAKVITLSAVDTDGDSLTFSVFSSDTSITTVISNDTLTMTPVADWNGSANITVVVTDNGTNTLSDTITFMLTVYSIDDLPVLANPLPDITVNEDASDTTLGDLKNVFLDVDEELIYSHVVNDTGLIFVSVTNDTVTLQFLADANGSTEIVFTATNPTIRASVSDTALVTVLPMNDAPEIISYFPDTSMVEDDTLSLTIQVYDMDGDSLTNYCESDTSGVSVNWDEELITMTSAVDWNGSSDITVIVMDDSSAGDTANFTLTVEPANDPPLAAVLIYPTEQDTFSTHADNDSLIAFTWHPSVDVDSDVSYKLTIELEYFGNTYTDIHENISDTTIGVSSNSLDPILEMTSQDETVITYWVHTADEEYTIESDTGEFVLSREALGVGEGLSIPEVFALHQNYPNPFNPVTTLRYDLPELTHVNITIYNMLGRKVRTILNQQQDPGYKSLIWDTTNDYGKPVSAGIYLYQIQAGEYISTKKMVLLK